MNVLVTGAGGFIGKNLISNLSEHKKINPIIFLKSNSLHELKKNLLACDAVVHLAAVNRSELKSNFINTNFKLTKTICEIIENNKKKIPIIYISSIHDKKKTYYGLSKKQAIEYLKKYSKKNKNIVEVLRLHRVFGKWSRPNYNSSVATFCQLLHSNKRIELFNKSKILEYNYIDDVIELINYLLFKKKYQSKSKNFFHVNVLKNIYRLSSEQLLKKLYIIKKKDFNLDLSNLGEEDSISKILYTTYISFLPHNKITTKLKTLKDKRGSFTEILKTEKDGQFSFFTCEPGETRGEHYHNTKLEKFLVVSGSAEFRLRNLHDNKIIKFTLSDKSPELLTSIPGYVHDIKNIGKEKLVVFVWANENFNKKKPDTYKKKIL
jgi:UDP-2-acetamido-2,6-beta-L-arabino-hexul-4-ose reductase